jgi:hypothetical protein
MRILQWADEGVLVRVVCSGNVWWWARGGLARWLGGEALQVNGVSAIARADVARVLLRALTTDAWRLAGLRFDVCAATTGTPTGTTAGALDHVLASAQWPWAR